LINQALDKAKVETGSEFSAVNLEAISMDYLAGPSKPAKEAKATKEEKVKATKDGLKDYMENFTWEEVLGVFEIVWPDVDLMVESE
jgi:protein involved in sex pheromone biosynthesis